MTVYNINFKTGKLEAIDNVNLLPVGSLVSYGDQANERTRAVVTGSRIASHGQTCVFEDGHQSEVSRNVIDGPGGWQLVTTEGKPLILDADQIKAFIEEAMQTKDRLQEELTRIQRVQKKRDEQERERIIIEFSWLTRLDGTRSPWSIGAAAELGYSLTPDQFDEWGSIKECVEYDRETIQTIYRQARAKEVK